MFRGVIGDRVNRQIPIRKNVRDSMQIQAEIGVIVRATRSCIPFVRNKLHPITDTMSLSPNRLRKRRRRLCVGMLPFDGCHVMF